MSEYERAVLKLLAGIVSQLGVLATQNMIDNGNASAARENTEQVIAWINYTKALIDAEARQESTWCNIEFEADPKTGKPCGSKHSRHSLVVEAKDYDSLKSALLAAQQEIARLQQEMDAAKLVVVRLTGALREQSAPKEPA